MNKRKFQKEGEKWVEEGIINENQLEQILARYETKDGSNLLVLFSILLISIGIIIFAFSEWTQVSALFRVIIMVVFMTVLYLLGHRIYEKDNQEKTINFYGLSFLLLGYVFFGATLLLIINVYEVTLFNIWPLIIWSFIGILLYAIYEHRYILALGMIIAIISQLYSAMAFSSFDYIMFLIFMLGYFHFVFHHSNRLFGYIFAIGLAIQLVILTMMEIDQYYWFIIFAMGIYLLSQIIQKPSLRTALFYISIWTVLLFRMYESFILQEEYFVNEMEVQPLFFIIWAIVAIVFIGLKWWKGNKLEAIDFILFLPFFFLPYNYIFIIVTMFIFSVCWLVIGFQRNIHEKIIIGIVGFLISTLTVYVQFAWETLNRSLFFLIGGVLLFIISFLLERKRRTSSKKGDDVR